MGLFRKKVKVVREIHDGLWGHLCKVHNVDVETLSRDIRCVERQGERDDGTPVTLVRVFSLANAADQNITVTGWEIFDQHPELVLYEGYLTKQNEASLTKKQV